MKKVLGIGFLVVAVVVLYFGFVGWPSLDVNIWALFPVGLFLFFTLENLVKKDYKASIMCLIIAFIVLEIVSRIFAKKNLKAFLASHPQTPLTEEKKRLLVFGAILSCYRSEDILSIITDDNMNVYKTGLQKQWSINGREDALETLNALLNLELSTELDEVLAQGGSSEELIELQTLIADGLKTDLAQVQTTTSTYAWDVCRLVSLAKWCYWLQYISEAEMWKYLNEGAEKASSLGKDWNDYTVSFLMGRAIHGFGTEDIIDDCKALYHRESDTDVYSKYSFK